MKALKGTRYYEAILQLRQPTEAIMRFTEKRLKQQEHKVMVTNEKRLKNGVDLYITSKRFAKRLGEVLLERFGGELKVNERLFTKDRQTSKDVYRINVLFRPLPLCKGEVATANDKIIRITNIGKRISGVNIATGKKETIDYKRTDVKALKALKTVVSKAFPRVEVIHPETFQSTPVNNPKPLKPGENVKVVVHNGLWIV